MLRPEALKKIEYRYKCEKMYTDWSVDIDRDRAGAEYYDTTGERLTRVLVGRRTTGKNTAAVACLSLNYRHLCILSVTRTAAQTPTRPDTYAYSSLISEIRNFVISLRRFRKNSTSSGFEFSAVTLEIKW